jgi:hypothetical protein
MIIKKFKNSLHLKREKEKTWEDYWDSDDLLMNDLYIVTSGGWFYLLDTSEDKVYMLNSYTWNWIDELKKNKTLILKAMPNDPEYEFNKE